MPSNELRKPLKALTIPLSHHDRAHEYLNRPDPLHLRLTLPRRLIQAQPMSQLVLTDRLRVVDLVPEDEEGYFGQIFETK